MGQSLLYMLVDSFLCGVSSKLKILNPEILKTNPREKGIRYDLKIIDESGCHINVEMQNTSLTKGQIKRFGYYGCQLVHESLFAGDSYEQLPQHIQIIFINDCHSHICSFIEKYEFRTEMGVFEGESKMNADELLSIRYYVYIPFIDYIVNEKGLMNLDDFEMIVYMMRYGIQEQIKQLNRKVVFYMERKAEEFYQNDQLREMAFNRKVEMLCLEEDKKEYYENGKEIGFKNGEKSGQIKVIINMIKEKYPHQQDFQWVDSLDEKLVTSIINLLIQSKSYEEFYEKARLLMKQNISIAI